MLFNIEVIWKILVGFRNHIELHLLSEVNFSALFIIQVSATGLQTGLYAFLFFTFSWFSFNKTMGGLIVYIQVMVSHPNLCAP